MDNVTIQFSNGDTLVARGLAQFTISTLNREYFVYSLNEHSDGDLIKTYIACISDDGIINDREWDTIKKYLSKMTHSEEMPELSFVNFEGKIVKLSEIHPKKIALKATQIDGIVKYQKERILDSLRNDDTSIMGEADEKKERKSFIDGDLLVKEEEEQAVDTGINIFNNPMKPEYDVPQEESAFDNSGMSPVDEVIKKDEEIINISNEIQNIKDKVNERSDSMLQTEKEQIMSALTKAGDALNEATAAVESAKALLERVNINDNIVKSSDNELQGEIIDMTSMISEPVPTVDTPAFEPQTPVEEVTKVNEAPAFEPQPIEQVETVVQNAEPQPIEQVERVLQNAEPQPIEQAERVVQNVEPQPIEQAETISAEPLFGTPEKPYVEPNYSEVPPMMPNDLVAEQPEVQIYGPGSLDAGVQETGGIQRQLAS